MNKVEAPKSELNLLPSATLLSKVAACAIIEDELPSDLAEQHDYHLYGVSKK
jgi:hypothetical protein